jgi:hypothetical protein
MPALLTHRARDVFPRGAQSPLMARLAPRGVRPSVLKGWGHPKGEWRQECYWTVEKSGLCIRTVIGLTTGTNHISAALVVHSVHKLVCFASYVENWKTGD